MYASESELASMLVKQIQDVKQTYSAWADPHELAHQLEISITFGKLGLDQEGAAFAEDIVLDPTVRVKARQRFTLYHEIVHHLIRRNDVLYSILHDQYRSDEDFTRIIERLCNIGAAEFIIPRDSVTAAIETSGFSIALVRNLSKADVVSATAVCVQLIVCARHQCLAVICKMIQPPKENISSLFGQVKPKAALQVVTSVSSTYTKYAVARESLIPKGHLLYEVHESEHEDVIRGKAPIPFRNNHSWIVECEAIRIGPQVFGLFHMEPPPIQSRHQLRLF